MFGFGKTNQPTPQQKTTQQPAQDPQGNGPAKPEPTGLDKFAKLLDNKDSKGTGQAQQKQRTDVNSLFKDQNFLGGLRTNFRQQVNSSISDEVRQKLANGDPEALMELMSSVAESAYVQALQHGASLNGLVLGEQLEDFSQNTESLVGKKLQDQQYISAIPQLQNPIVQLGVQAFMDKVREQNPTITPDEMKAQMNEYISELGKDLGVIQQPDAPKDDLTKGVDWFAELGMEPPPSQS